MFNFFVVLFASCSRRSAATLSQSRTRIMPYVSSSSSPVKLIPYHYYKPIHTSGARNIFSVLFHIISFTIFFFSLHIFAVVVIGCLFLSSSNYKFSCLLQSYYDVQYCCSHFLPHTISNELSKYAAAAVVETQSSACVWVRERERERLWLCVCLCVCCECRVLFFSLEFFFPLFFVLFLLLLLFSFRIRSYQWVLINIIRTSSVASTVSNWHVCSFLGFCVGVNVSLSQTHTHTLSFCLRCFSIFASTSGRDWLLMPSSDIRSWVERFVIAYPQRIFHRKPQEKCSKQYIDVAVVVGTDDRMRVRSFHSEIHSQHLQLQLFLFLSFVCVTEWMTVCVCVQQTIAVAVQTDWIRIQMINGFGTMM